MYSFLSSKWNHRITEYFKSEVSHLVKPPLKAGQTGSGCPRPYPGKFSASPGKEFFLGFSLDPFLSHHHLSLREIMLCFLC